MIKIQTSYYGNLKNNKDILYNPICISIVRPLWLDKSIPSFTKLMPSMAMLDAYKKKKITYDVYESLMNFRLSKLNAGCIVEDLRKLVNDDKFTLLCYEKSSNPNCHRHIVARWITLGTGIVVNEAPNPPKKR